jgi:hypothetical protein
MASVCSSCGTETAEVSAYCPRCGQPMVRRDGVPVFVGERRELSVDRRSLARASIILGAAGSLFVLAGFYYLLAEPEVSSKIAGLLVLAYGGGHLAVAATGWEPRRNWIAATAFSALGLALGIAGLATPSSVVSGLAFLGFYGYVGLTLFRWRRYQG